MPNEKVIFAMSKRLLFSMIGSFYIGVALLLLALWLAPLATFLTFIACILIWIGTYIYVQYYRVQ